MIACKKRGRGDGGVATAGVLVVCVGWRGEVVAKGEFRCGEQHNHARACDCG